MGGMDSEGFWGVRGEDGNRKLKGMFVYAFVCVEFIYVVTFRVRVFYNVYWIV